MERRGKAPSPPHSRTLRLLLNKKKGLRITYTVKKRLSFFQSPAGMSLTKVWSVTCHLHC